MRVFLLFRRVSATPSLISVEAANFLADRRAPVIFRCADGSRPLSGFATNLHQRVHSWRM